MITDPVRSPLVIPVLACLLGVGLPLQGHAQRVAASVDSAASVVDYTGSATMHDWTGTSRDVSGTFVIDLDTPDSSRAVVQAPVASFTSGPDRRDRKMREVAEADRYPIVSFRATHIRSRQWGRSHDGHAGRWTVTGDLTFHGQTHPVDVRVTDDSVHAHAQFPVSLTRFDVERPKLMWVAPIADTIRIDARVSGARQDSSPQTQGLDTTRNEITGTRRVASTDLRPLPSGRYAGTRARLHAAMQRPAGGEREWILAVYGFAEKSTGLTDTQDVVLRADGQSLPLLHTTGSIRQIEDDTSVEILEMVLSRSAFRTLAEALTASATVGPARFSLPWETRRDLRLILEKTPEDAPGPASTRDGG